MGHSVDRLWEDRDNKFLDEPHARLADAHRALVKAELSVAFHRDLLNRLTSGELPVDQALFDRLGRTLTQLQDAAASRDERQDEVLSALEPVEAAARTARPATTPELPASDFAALLAISPGGAKLHEHLLTGRKSVMTASGTRVMEGTLRRLESAGLVVRDTTRPVHAGQPVTLTDDGRAVLAGSRRTAPSASAPVSRPGAWPAPARMRH
ncbi:hypothetical protein [Streptomyces sp. NPDC088141]|uniref:hypothetical protein n=1 Tax=Streptomyces sp. NPDC088141 TaxID=3155179 RepID=UPI003427A8FA